ncbi:hypothetical protein, partial [Pseudomonas sp.]|uniref:hypothetical protein n=1 Tax=Pseudomonas sp. TaxID=306 RepID=UPI00257DA752
SISKKEKPYHQSTYRFPPLHQIDKLFWVAINKLFALLDPFLVARLMATPWHCMVTRTMPGLVQIHNSSWKHLAVARFNPVTAVRNRT